MKKHYNKLLQEELARQAAKCTIELCRASSLVVDRNAGMVTSLNLVPTCKAWVHKVFHQVDFCCLLLISGNKSSDDSSASPRASIALDNLPITDGERGVGRMVPDSTAVGCNLNTLAPSVNPHAHHLCQTICVEKSCRPASLPRRKLLKRRSVLELAHTRLVHDQSRALKGTVWLSGTSQKISGLCYHLPSERPTTPALLIVAVKGCSMLHCSKLEPRTPTFRLLSTQAVAAGHG